MGRLTRPGTSLPALASLVVLVMVAVLTIGAIIVSRATASLNALRGTAATADEVTEAAEGLLMSLQEAEAGQNGYLLTGRPEYLAPYWAATGRMRADLTQLDAVAEHETWLRPEIRTLRSLGERRVSELEHSITAADTSGITAARATMITDDSQATMEAARVVIDRIEAHATADRDRGSVKMQRSERSLFLSVLLTAAAGLLLLGTASLGLLIGRSRLLRAQEIARDRSARWQGTVENLQGGVAVFDAADRLVLCNAKMVPITGLPPGLAEPGTPFARFVAETAHWDPPVLEAGPIRAAGIATEARCADRVLEVSRNVMPGGGHMLAIGDATQRVQTEAIARQSQKMEVLGQLTGGVAHDFNNLLQIVSANLELVEDGIPDDPGLRARLAGAMEGVQRGARLTRHLLALARRQPLAPAALDAGRLLAGLDDMLRRAVGSSVTLEIEVAQDLWFLRADAQQLENALLNLAINARDAMAGQDRPARLTITARNAGLDDSAAAQNAEVTPGQYVAIAVADTGRGMTAEQIVRAVEPFYTTKPEGQGTGLGLSMVHGFARQSGGHLKLHSEVGRGTTACLYIPRTIALPEAPEQQAGDAPRAKGETVLLVEDEPVVRASAGRALRGLGYGVEEAADADAAMRMIEQGLRPHVLLTDTVLPGVLTARAMAERAQALIPSLAVIFTSGYAESGAQPDQRLDLVSKPWRTADLARRLRLALARAQPAPARLRILLVENEDLVRVITAEKLTGMGHEVVEASSAEDAMQCLTGIHLLIADVGLDGADGLTLAASAQASLPGLPVIMASGHPKPTQGGEAFTWLAKPYDERALQAAMAAALRTAR